MSSVSKPHRNPGRAAQKAMAEYMGMTNKQLNKHLRKTGTKALLQGMIRNFLEEYKNGKRS
jgi:hypothetical protein